MELLQLFDDKLNKLDESIPRDKKLILPDNRYFMIILLFIQNDEGKYLVQKTSKEKESVYAVTGGHVTYGDDDYITVFKEADEELGLKLDKDKLTRINIVKYSKGYCAIYYYKDNINLKDLVLQKEEVENVYWLTDEEIENLIKEDKFRKGNISNYEIVKKWLKER